MKIWKIVDDDRVILNLSISNLELVYAALCKDDATKEIALYIKSKCRIESLD